MFGFVRRFVVLVYFPRAKIVPWGLMDWLLMVYCNRCCVGFVKKKDTSVFFFDKTCRRS